MQFAWYFRYPGPDGKFGATKPELEDASAGGEAALGLDPKDPASKDDVVTGTMVVPVNREIEVIIRAHDVIHSFSIPAMRFKRYSSPGPPTVAYCSSSAPASCGRLPNRILERTR